MEFDKKTHILIDKTLENKDQASAYILFLESEEWRHQEDIWEIMRRVEKIKEK